MECVGRPRRRCGVRLRRDDVSARAQRGGQVDCVACDGGGRDDDGPPGGAGGRAEEGVGREDDAGRLEGGGEVWARGGGVRGRKGGGCMG
jgi:hypothetical protein